MRRFEAVAFKADSRLQFLRELHFIEAQDDATHQRRLPQLQFLRELHFIEAGASTTSATASP